MKTLSTILAASFLLLGANVNAQSNKGNNDGAPDVKKGYYSIGNNATKLNGESALGVTVSESYPDVQKGYYSIDNNNRKLGWQHVIDSRAMGYVPFVTKGFYSIGHNNEKLKR